MNHVQAILPLIILLCTGCGLLPQYTGQSKIASIEGEGKHAEIRRDLIRASMNGIDEVSRVYFAEAVPLTPALETARVRELCAKNLETDERCNVQVAQNLSLFESKKCFQVVLQSKDNIELAKPNMWKIKIEQPDGKIRDGEMSAFKSVPDVNLNSRSFPFNNSGIVCYPKDLDFKKRMRMILIPQFGGAEAKALELIWETPK